MDRLKSLYNKINSRFPAIGNTLYRIYIRKPFNSVKRKIRGRNNSISYNNSILSSVKFDIIGNNNDIVIDKKCQLNKVTFLIRGDNHKIYIGKETLFFDESEIVFFDSNGTLNIGDGSRFWGTHIAVTEPNSIITIGNHCSFAYDVDVRTGDSHSIISLNTNKRINYAKDVFIGNRVWIAAHSVILKGVKICEDSVVATGSVVTTKFTDTNVIIAGNPAKIIKRNISWSRERIE